MKIAGLAALLGVGVIAGTEPAAAQFSVQIGSDRPRVERRVYREPRVIERHVYRRAPRRTVCTRTWRTEITPRGIVRRPGRAVPHPRLLIARSAERPFRF